MADPNPRRRHPVRDVDGILLLDKPVGISSNAALQRAKRAFAARKAGHTGNLDVLAGGLLPICFGEATKICSFLLEADKTYVSDFHLGVVTATGDSEGEVLRRETNVAVNDSDAFRAVSQFRGEIEQIPPMYSALKRNGQPLYKLARQGIEVERKRRRVTIRRLDLVALDGTKMTVEVACSKGTYIRTLAEDIGDFLGCGAHVSALRRLRSGAFSVDSAVSLDEVETVCERPDALTELDQHLLPMDAALVDLPDLYLTDESAFCVTRGQAVCVPNAPPAGFVRLYRAERQFLGVGHILDDGRVAPRRLMRM